MLAYYRAARLHELIASLLALMFGLFGRFAAAGLFILNAIALYSCYPELSEAGRHLYWGLLLAVLLTFSRGRWALDFYLERRLRNQTVCSR